MELLRGASGLFAAEGAVTAAKFHTYVDRLNLDTNYAGVQAIGFARHVKPGDLDRVLADARRAVGADFHVWPDAPPGDERQVVEYIEPPGRRNETVLGFDMYTDPTRRAAMQAARDAGHPAAS